MINRELENYLLLIGFTKDRIRKDNQLSYTYRMVTPRGSYGYKFYLVIGGGANNTDHCDILSGMISAGNVIIMNTMVSIFSSDNFVSGEDMNNIISISKPYAAKGYQTLREFLDETFKDEIRSKKIDLII